MAEEFNLNLVNSSFDVVRYMENYESCIWTERFDEHGECILKVSRKYYSRSDFPLGWYFYLQGSDELMIIRSRELKWDPKRGRHLEIRAKALTAILDQRTVFAQTDLDSSLYLAVRKLLLENAVSATDIARRFTNLGITPTALPAEYVVEAQVQGVKLYKAIQDLCGDYNVGFRITHQGGNLGIWAFTLIPGLDRSAGQTLRAPVIFSPEYDNLQNASYFQSREDYVSTVYVGGEGEGDKKKLRTVHRGAAASGLNRFEDFHNAPSQSSNGETISAAKYNAYLDREGKSFLKDHRGDAVFDGEADESMAAGYGKDYALGDLVQITDGTDINTQARVVEFIRSDDSSDGLKAYPTLRIEEN